MNKIVFIVLGYYTRYGIGQSALRFNIGQVRSFKNMAIGNNMALPVDKKTATKTNRVSDIVSNKNCDNRRLKSVN